MNFKRIEIIFIIVFAFLDAFLVFSFWQNESGIRTSSNSDKNATILSEMRNDQISFSPLSNKTLRGYYASGEIDNVFRDTKQLAGQTTRVSNGILTSNLSTPISISIKNPSQTLDDFVDNPSNIILGSKYRYNSHLSNGSQVVYTQHVDGHSVYSHFGELVFNVNNNGLVTGYTQGYISNVAPLREESDLISQARAVTWLYQYNEIPNDSKIEWADLGYTHLLDGNNGLVYVPTWVIGVKSKNNPNVQIKRIDAFTGMIMKHDSQTTVTDSENENSAASDVTETIGAPAGSSATSTVASDNATSSSNTVVRSRSERMNSVR
ncbi:two-component system regulatory protein YycI [Pediococcus claussenii]|uniref:YycH family protein n=1 Tax=Pediococcus claussenii (strain ATCC BAA-344 / DSM 14800 / JCM 18046 / KCTC 3811 / LMG 21948 / P06) TaxID=701521 RepID=G8PBY2_PEDCP|nr:two-component system regulatory protein YycI [Pediococcus claussenii]AEV96040.1 yycH family protein [Pediococcus claussenii ATCC BAA-344]ANZ69524.1 hypothetical protein AYR57_04000 [Pediococcus claussenii]ANZ71343.1 hypothetical protein AYR58_04015 [Pediococcus claussenii]KRN19435.1 hypothetical protein IV79_GL001487 [Pediococcus claussenii]